jgi:hypothetical protein
VAAEGERASYGLDRTEWGIGGGGGGGDRTFRYIVAEMPVQNIFTRKEMPCEMCLRQSQRPWNFVFILHSFNQYLRNNSNHNYFLKYGYL